MAKVFYHYCCYNLFDSNNYSTLFCKFYNEEYLDNVAVEYTHEQKKGSKVRDVRKKSIKIFYKDEVVTENEIKKRTYEVYQRILRDLSILNKSSEIQIG